MIDATAFTNEADYYEALDELDNAFFFRNESQAAFDQSRRETSIPNDRKLIDEATAQGKFVVFYEYPVHCRHTDAVLGMGTRFVSAHDTAEEAWAAIGEPSEGDGVAEPSKPQEVVARYEGPESEIPF